VSLSGCIHWKLAVTLSAEGRECARCINKRLEAWQIITLQREGSLSTSVQRRVPQSAYESVREHAGE
jgi:hypothetical protein